jgi:hypothetical protein
VVNIATPGIAKGRHDRTRLNVPAKIIRPALTTKAQNIFIAHSLE